jgi:hypothetical protein
VRTPIGYTYATKPGGSLFFPTWAMSTPASPGGSVKPGEYRATTMPVRKRSRVKARADRVKQERALNDAYVAERNKPPPF